MKQLDLINYRLGKTFNTKAYGSVKVTEYFNASNCTVEFEDGFTVRNLAFSRVLRGEVRNPYYPNVYGKGYIGEGKYNSGKDKLEYKVWANMLQRAYSKKYHEKFPTYKDVMVCEEWHNFQNFAEWFEENYIEGFCLDKDFLVKANKTYSLETCCFVPGEINTILSKVSEKYKERLPGITKSGNKYCCKISKNSNQIHLGSYMTQEEASEVYIRAKKEYLKEIAEKWKGSIPEKVYQNLINYEF